jgi:hypothetical protein
MKAKILVCLLGCLILACGTAGAETRTYCQVRDISAKENGRVSQSTKKGDLFEYVFDVNYAKKTITRTSVRRLDKAAPEKDATVYNIMQKTELLGSKAGNGGKVLIAVRQDGGEILELGHRFAFTMRTSPFSQVITGVYKRNYAKDRKKFPRKHGKKYKKR